MDPALKTSIETSALGRRFFEARGIEVSAVRAAPTWDGRARFGLTVPGSTVWDVLPDAAERLTKALSAAAPPAWSWDVHDKEVLFIRRGRK